MKSPNRAKSPRVTKASTTKKAAKKASKASPKAPAARSAAASRATKPSTDAARRPAARRADFGAPVDGFFEKQPPHLRSILEELRKLVHEVAPDATATIKWGMPFYSVGPSMVCALAAFKSHVNLILAGPPGTFSDPGGLLGGDGKTGRHLKLRAIEDLPAKTVRTWLRAALRAARASG